VGESGCGKTTTVQSLLRMIEPTGGSITFDGVDITKLSSERMRSMRKRLQMIFQDPYESLDPRFLVRQLVEEPLLIHGLAGPRRGRREQVRQALERVGLSPADLYMDRYPHELSGGQRQRVAIATSLVLEPELLLADEPVSMLDVSVRAGILSLLDALRRDGQMGILMITHDLSTAAHFADRIAVMYLGRIVECGPAWEVVENPQHPYTKALVSVIPKGDPRQSRTATLLKGETPNAANLPDGCRFAQRCPIAEERCKDVDPQLRRPAGSKTSDHEAACVLA
jgi:oligopeptide/dipeptide ABC transporter ATP-binding protein